MKIFFRVGFVLLFSLTTIFAVTKIMPLGNSITYDDTYADKDDPRPTSKRSGYRNYLWYFLDDAGYAADFVGSQRTGDAIRPHFDPDNEGHPGWKSYQIADHTYEYMTNSQPDIVLLHIGTNDRASTSPGGVNRILSEIDRYENDNAHPVKVFVALIIDRKDHDGRIDIFNRRLLGLLQDRIAQGDNLVMVDMYHNAGLTSGDYTDETHPDNDGYYKMARVWFDALINNPYDPQAPLPESSITPLEFYPESLVPSEYIEYKTIVGDTVEFMVTVPDSGIIFK